jgi:hypothetical protein
VTGIASNQDTKELVQKWPDVPLVSILTKTTEPDVVIADLIRALGYSVVKVVPSKDGMEFLAGASADSLSLRAQYQDARMTGPDIVLIEQAYKIVQFFENQSHEVALLRADLRQEAIRRFCAASKVDESLFSKVIRNWT